MEDEFREEFIEFLMSHAFEGIPDNQEIQRELDSLGID